MARYIFPKGHPHEGKTIVQGGVKFIGGATEITPENAEQAAKLAPVIKIITTYHGAVLEGSPEQLEAEAMYEQIAADAEKAAKKSKRKAARTAAQEAEDEGDDTGSAE